MSRKPASVILTEEDRETLMQWTRQTSCERRYAERARIILMAADGRSGDEIATDLDMRPGRISKWRTRFARQGIAGLRDAPRSGPPRRYSAETERRVLAVLDEAAPRGYGRWNGARIAQRLGDVSKHQVWRVLRDRRISLERRRSWCVSTDPEFARKAADVVGLYLDPPENAVVLSVDEKPHIQALERAQGWLRMPDGKALTGFSHEYTRHGTSTLFAALEVATGRVKAGHFTRRRRRDFLAFMNEVVMAYPDQDLHVILDNLSTHKPKQDRWLKLHPRVHFHFTPTHASWLNQIEIWFSLLSRYALAGNSFLHVRQLRQAIDAFIAAHNQVAHPFAWTKATVVQKPLAHKLANLCN